jgi:phytoene dehydrogenase-like protein
MTKTAVAIIGGGIAGLTAATYLARAGQGVTVIEKSQSLGGRARTEHQHEFALNFGPHALYSKAQGATILRELGVAFRGTNPGSTGAYLLDRGQKYTLPGGFVSLLATSFLPLPAKLEAARLLAGIGKIDAAAVAQLSVRDWLEQTIQHTSVRQLVQVLFRVTSYAHDPERQSAGAAIAQLQTGLADGVLYLDDGWQTIVNGLRQAAEKAGAQIQAGVSMTALEQRGQEWLLQLADGTQLTAASVILALGPTEAAALLKGSGKTKLAEWAHQAIPVRVACLDIGLTHLPVPHGRFALGVDQPYYFSVHSATAKLAPNGGALIHVAKYLGADLSEPAQAVEQKLEGILDMMQPGWRELVRVRRFLPRMTVTQALVTAAQGGLAGRPGPAVPGLSELYVAGDWVGSEGQLADASFASAKQAATIILQQQAPYAAAA